jgi:hypothetical protein
LYALSVRNVTRIIPASVAITDSCAAAIWTGGHVLVFLILAARRWAKSEVNTERYRPEGEQAGGQPENWEI